MTPDTNMMEKATAAVLEDLLASGVIDDARAGDWVGILSARVARDAIAAMREPTEAMIEAHLCAVDAFDDHRRQAVIDWQAMIDAALGSQG